MEKKIHHGKNIARFRQLLGMKQDALAAVMGDDWTQLKISRLEAKDEVEEGILAVVASALKIPVEAIKNFDEEAAISIVANTFHDFKENAVAIATHYTPTFNPIDKIVEILEQANKDLKKEVVELRKENERLKKAKK